MTFHYKLSRDWTVYAIASAITYQGGYLDSTIEQFHDTFGFSSFGRPAVARNQATLIYDLKGAHVVLLDKPTDGGLTDPTIGFRYTGWQPLQDWRLSLEAAAKIPVAGRVRQLGVALRQPDRLCKVMCEVLHMATNLSIDPALVEEALKISGERTKAAAVTKALQEFIARRRQKAMLDLAGKLEWDSGFDYKKERSRR